MIKGYHHFAINTTDIERSARFYRDVLGMQEKMRLSFDDGGYLIMMALGDTCVELFGGAQPKDPASDRKEVGYVHLALTVDDCDAEYRRIKDLGCSFYVEPRTFKNVLRCAFFRDPDGIPIELVQEL